MMRARDLVMTIDRLTDGDLDIWIREELVVADLAADEPAFSEVECARVRLLCTLRYELEVEADSLPLVLSLIDQLYETRQRFLSLTSAVAAQDEEVRRSILATLEVVRGEG